MPGGGSGPVPGRPGGAPERDRPETEASGGAVFVNPYTFVPLPRFPDEDGTGHRRPPAGHERLAPDRLSGRIEVELTAAAPLLLRGIRKGEEERFPRRAFPPPPDPAGSHGAHGAHEVPFLPGSSLAGTVRALHETLAGGCLRVFDADFRPGYRDAARTRHRGWKPALVTETEHGRPAAVRMCTEVVWADSADLARVLGSPERVVTGAEVRVTGWERHQHFGRNHARGDQVAAGDGWVVLVTDSGAREDNPRCHTYWCAVGKLPAADAPALGVSDAAWQDFQAAVADAEDVRVARREHRLDTGKAERKPVTWRGARIGERHEARPRLYPGQVVWAAAGGTPRAVTGLALAAIWRHPGGFTAGERVPTALLPCTAPDALCPSCRLFGSADTGGADTAEARQSSYRGHIRFGDARPAPGTGAPRTRPVRLAPLGAPRPGAGQFYLANDAKRLEPAAEGDLPLREWGSPADHAPPPRSARRGGQDKNRKQKQPKNRGRYADQSADRAGTGQRRPAAPPVTATGRPSAGAGAPGAPDASGAPGSPDAPGGPQPRPRPLRGRKQYWLTARHAERPFFRTRRGRWEGEMARDAEQVDAGARFVFTVYVDGLTAAELGGLLAALNPALLFDDAPDPVGYAVGGAKPLGFGACTARITGLDLTDAAARYTTGGPATPPPTAEEAVAAFRAQVPAEVTVTWRAARAALTLDRVPPGIVWYPPQKPIPDGELHPDDLAPAFRGFWKHSRGEELSHSTRPLIPLPRAAAPADEQTLPVLDDKGKPAP
ncbi:RAMP superfamily CRISPR-associated protein [Streptomyces aidingensis]|uniref:RAMP superfamily CRISPR-associated protein n=1 Tax=Streptomyces aidingensis TaxID=910347 RepID=UPI000B857FFF|nr:RAMP superfamily CRISPR-associated protein [Streptomyces aidingensis]